MLVPHGRVLVVGGRPSNFDDYWLNHPRIVFWNSDSAEVRRCDFPANVRVVVTTRFLGHTPFNNIKREALKRRVPVFGPMNTGQLREKLEEWLPREEKLIMTEPTAPAPAPTFKSIAAWVREMMEADPSIKPRRLHELRPDVKHSSIDSAFFAAKRKARPAPMKPAPTPAKTVKGHPLDQLLDEAILNLQLIRDELSKLTAENQQLKDHLETIASAVKGVQS
jgi:hypothetical protein